MSFTHQYQYPAKKEKIIDGFVLEHGFVIWPINTRLRANGLNNYFCYDCLKQRTKRINLYEKLAFLIFFPYPQKMRRTLNAGVYNYLLPIHSVRGAITVYKPNNNSTGLHSKKIKSSRKAIMRNNKAMCVISQLSFSEKKGKF